MRLHSLKLTNFRGIKNKSFIFEGESATIYGENYSGKTTIANAYVYLLTDKSFTGEANFSPKTIDKGGETHKLNHIVEGVFLTDSGSKITLTKDFHEVWKKQRGSQSESFAGHEVDYFIDGVPTKQGDFNKRVEELFGDMKTIQILSNPAYFAEVLPWKERRDILFSVCGDVDDSKILKELPELDQALTKEGSDDRYSVEDLQQIHTSLRRKLNSEIDQIPARVDEATKAIPEKPKHTKTGLETLIKNNQKEIEKLKIQLTDKKSATDEVELSLLAEISNLKKDLQKAEMSFSEDSQKELGELNKEIRELEYNLRSLENVKATAEAQIREEESGLENLNAIRQGIIADHKEISSEVFEGDEHCPTCHQLLPEDQRNSAREQWNLSKSDRLEKLMERAKRYDKEAVRKQELKISRLKEEEESAVTRIKEVESRIATLTNTFESLKSNLPLFEESDIFQKITEAIFEKEERIALIKEDREDSEDLSDIHNEIRAKISTLETQINDARTSLADYLLIEKQTERIADLEDRHKQLAIEYERSERIIFLCEQYIAKRAELITERVNDYFKNVSFKLFEVQINGGIKDLCEVQVPDKHGAMIPWRPEGPANHAATVNGGLEIISVLSKYYNRELPIFIDFAESVTHFIDVANQVIRLKVSEEHENLTIERK